MFNGAYGQRVIIDLRSGAWPNPSPNARTVAHTTVPLARCNRINPPIFGRAHAGAVLVQTSVMENAQSEWLPELLAMLEAAGKAA